MIFTFHRKIIFSTFLCLSMISGIYGQVYRFKNYGVDSKIPNTFIYTIDQSKSGYLWIGTANGISRFDGFDFFNIPYPDSVIGRYPKASLKDKNETMWYGCSDGTVFYNSGDKLKKLVFKNSKSISDIAEGPDGNIYLFTQGESIYKINPENPDEIKRYQIEIDPSLTILTASFATGSRLLIGTSENLQVLSVDKDTIINLETIEGFDYNPVMAIQDIDSLGNFLVGTDGNGLFRLKLSTEGNVLSRFPEKYGLNLLRIQAVSEDKEHSFWVSSFEQGMVQIKLNGNNEIRSIQHFDKNSGLAGNDVKLVYQDSEGNFWIGLFGDGLSLLNSYAYSYYEPGSSPGSNNIIYIDKINENYFLGTPDGYYLFDPENFHKQEIRNLSKRTGGKGIASYFIDSNSNIWIGTEGNGLFLMSKEGAIRQVFRSGESGSDFIMDVITDDRNIWLATKNGVIILDLKSGRQKEKYNIDNGLPHNSINQIFLTKNGDAYIATESDRIYKIVPDSGIVAGDSRMQGNYLNKVSSYSMGKDGSIWAATLGNGVFQCSADSVIAIDRTRGLMSNYCYSILVDSRNRVWMGHERGFSRYDLSAGSIKVFGVDFAHSGACNPQAIYESSDGKLLIGTTEGLILYDSEKDKKRSAAPVNNINYVSINDVLYPYQPVYSLPYRKRYAIKVGYVGIYFSDPEKVYYSTMLENYDNEWTRLSSNREMPYSLSDGRFKYNLISVNDEGLSQEVPVSFEIDIQKPIWRTWWGILLFITVFAGIIIIIIRERDKAQKKVQEYLEKELEARTSVVMKQKGEIEIQNIEITDSINYAKRIQTSILPDIHKLRETFRDAFILFHPRDIVSGDFFWFDRLPNDIFVLVCADSTGHGVPGAFMSMIGSTLLHDIVTRQRISKPSEVLTLLDKQIFSTLNQNDELGVSNDGMDIVVCEFNIKTNYVRFASAMRPVIIVMDGEPYYIKGNRSSVGGESVIEKYYDDQEYYLNPGDIIYMFSDGLPDQFGGQDGKKMKIARLKKLVETISKLPMDEQKEVILKFYNDWKGDLEQVDDILIMGVRV